MIAYSILLGSLIAFAASQNVKSWKDASILNEARYLAATGQFGAAFKQDDGVEFKEEADDSGNRRGSYSYIDPSGVRRTVSYTAGKDGFKATGDHIPSGGDAAAPAAVAQPQSPIASYVASAGARSSNGPALDSGFYNPDFDYPDDSKNADNGQYVEQPQQQQQSYNNVQQSQPSYISQQQPQLSSYYRSAPSVAAPQQQNSYTSQFNVPSGFSGSYSTSAPSGFYNQINTEAPTWNSRAAQSYPGKLSLNRSPDGFSYTFSTS